MMKDEVHELMHNQDWYDLAAYHGARYMDREDPGWVNQVNRALLDLRDSRLCILGQRFGDFYAGRESLNLSRGEVYNFGFDIAGAPTAQDYSMLTESWLREINDRLPSFSYL